MKAHETIQTMVGTAIVDPVFRRDLIAKSPHVLRDFDLTPEEVEAITSVESTTFVGFVTELDRWINRSNAVVHSIS